ncbi:hypothetical protein PRZ48_012034 [Zasmidium cellare]|uniref:Uncharacterized protein n=1 Tax=Zasmidium cellare TaxID=395010 RepID=A0ABR0E820_ZASCE|nr:hypothetical protein PRZ48_012034 [Zasmidium cellare]
MSPVQEDVRELMAAGSAVAPDEAQKAVFTCIHELHNEKSQMANVQSQDLELLSVIADSLRLHLTIHAHCLLLLNRAFREPLTDQPSFARFYIAVKGLLRDLEYLAMLKSTNEFYAAGIALLDAITLASTPHPPTFTAHRQFFNLARSLAALVEEYVAEVPSLLILAKTIGIVVSLRAALAECSQLLPVVAMMASGVRALQQLPAFSDHQRQMQLIELESSFRMQIDRMPIRPMSSFDVTIFSFELQHGVQSRGADLRYRLSSLVLDCDYSTVLRYREEEFHDVKEEEEHDEDVKQVQPSQFSWKDYTRKPGGIKEEDLDEEDDGVVQQAQPSQFSWKDYARKPGDIKEKE